ncbi:type IV secretory system conjugative DNA transfer family protein [Neisseria chenwenguii]|uniref:Type IV secretory system conjugative DNA transfer family protein n=1 Tax=Neisseria chenwenguii TaxID=1853278 RepID=A0A220S173_9NEIS|nr:type IV secretory system conjugative DNA transfer family protein [Neisseria chenwenguii]ASK27162.1 type IV secretory system conjugative DNA transfer family protein [Neisseria chenwenguii]ROV56578.1 type IV secretory system conjugative DNA transfer family protein [Neisseria chenwenguii]
MKNKFFGLLAALGIFVPFGLAGGLYLGSTVMTTWLSLKAEPSVGMLYRYWHYYDRLKPGAQTAFEVSAFIALLIPAVTAVIICAAVLMKPKRELHGSARFAKRSEIAKHGLLKKKFQGDEEPDLLIGKYGNDYLRWVGNEFLYLAAPTRSGKGVGIVIPNCLHYRDSMVVFDPKLENFLISGGYRAEHGQEVFLFNPAGRMPEHERNPNAPLVSHRWNPCTYIRRNPVYTYKDVKDIAAIMYPKPVKDSGSATFFQESAQNLFAGLLLYMIETENERDLSLQENKTTLANLFRLTTPSDGHTLAEWIKDEVMLRDQQPQTRLSQNCRTLLMGFANGNAKTGADILATLTAPLGIFIDPVVEAATSGDDFYLDEVRKKRMTVYIGIVPTETAVFSRLTNLFFSQLVSVNVQQGLPSNNPDSLKYQCCLLMDEFTALGVIPAIQHGVSYIAGYGLRLLLIIQTPSQVTDLYGRDATRTFFTNFACQIVYPPREQTDAEEYSKLIGYETYKAKSVSRSAGKLGSRSTSTSDQRRAVMNPDELKMMPKSDCIISLGNSRPVYAQKIVYYQDPVFSKRANRPLPVIPPLDVRTVNKVSAAIPKAEFVPPEALDSFHWADASNAEDIARSLLSVLIPPGSPPDYVAQLVPVIAQNWGSGSLDFIAKILKDTSDTVAAA